MLSNSEFEAARARMEVSLERELTAEEQRQLLYSMQALPSSPSLDRRKPGDDGNSTQS